MLQRRRFLSIASSRVLMTVDPAAAFPERVSTAIFVVLVAGYFRLKYKPAILDLPYINNGLHKLHKSPTKIGPEPRPKYGPDPMGELPNPGHPHHQGGDPSPISTCQDTTRPWTKWGSEGRDHCQCAMHQCLCPQKLQSSRRRAYDSSLKPVTLLTSQSV